MKVNVSIEHSPPHHAIKLQTSKPGTLLMHKLYQGRKQLIILYRNSPRSLRGLFAIVEDTVE